MLKLNVPDMTCGHCASIVTKALRSVDPQAQIDIDLATRNVAVASTADAGALGAALQEAGYPGTPA
ncbi:heavy-metal-associated domain-containing protein [Hoeflea sp. YIM 152468]|uniref:heavy-metal-associated domain-containing protein n=1 Tax=Hoeflea sp. YIM 152468 TaxID=3031759 RepID=UPI0023DC96B4|nr:heavy-metal-associated domain-containing protein [Hoeflea sp. YIM 152468]MDF1608625.1 heavy-metal-associated domain-containing protein [Hoeflea sp. YIM 152468]